MVATREEVERAAGLVALMAVKVASMVVAMVAMAVEKTIAAACQVDSQEMVSVDWAMELEVHTRAA